MGNAAGECAGQPLKASCASPWVEQLALSIGVSSPEIGLSIIE